MKIVTLFSDDGINASIGRVLLWIILINDMFFWWLRDIKQFPETLYYVTGYLLAYNFGKKLMEPLNTFASRGITPATPAPTPAVTKAAPAAKADDDSYS